MYRSRKLQWLIPLILRKVQKRDQGSVDFFIVIIPYNIVHYYNTEIIRLFYSRSQTGYNNLKISKWMNVTILYKMEDYANISKI